MSKEVYSVIRDLRAFDVSGYVQRLWEMVEPDERVM